MLNMKRSVLLGVLCLFCLSATVKGGRREPKSGSLRVPDPDEITYWKCPSKGPGHTACQCTVSRVVVVPHGQYAPAKEADEYSSELQCNQNCGRDSGDTCYLCEVKVRYVGGNRVEDRECVHRADTVFNPTAVLVPQGFKCCPLQEFVANEKIFTP